VFADPSAALIQLERRVLLRHLLHADQNLHNCSGKLVSINERTASFVILPKRGNSMNVNSAKEGRRYCKQRGFSPAARNDNINSFQERHGLNSCHLEAFTATDILAGDHVVLTHHVGARLSELGAIALVSARRQL